MQKEESTFLEGIFEQGYGMVAKVIMRDPNIKAVAKAMYAYLVSFSGAGLVSFPHKSTICRELGIHEDTYSKYLSELIKAGYISVSPRRDDKTGHFLGNLYTIKSVITRANTEDLPEPEKIRSRAKKVSPRNPKKTVSGKNPGPEKIGSHISNTLFKSNKVDPINNNSEIKDVVVVMETDEAVINPQSHTTTNSKTQPPERTGLQGGDQILTEGDLTPIKEVCAKYKNLLPLASDLLYLSKTLVAAKGDVAKLTGVLEACGQYSNINHVQNIKGLIMHAIADNITPSPAMPDPQATYKQTTQAGDEDKFSLLHWGNFKSNDVSA